MPFDPEFQTEARTKRAHKASAKPNNESVEMQLGRSDFLLGSHGCPFPKQGADASEWRKGYDAERDKHPKPPINFNRPKWR